MRLILITGCFVGALIVISIGLFYPKGPNSSIRYWKCPLPTNLDFKSFSENDLHFDPRLFRLAAKMNQQMDVIKDTDKKFQLQYEGPAKFSLTRANYSVYPLVNLDSQGINGTFNLSYESFEGYLDFDSLHASRKLDADRNPQWTPQHAIEIGTEFLHRLADTGSVLLNAPTASFKVTPNNIVGEWEVSWRRIDGKGHTFYGGATLNISETVGLIAANINLSEPYKPETGTMLTKDQAIDIAKRSRPAMGTPSNDISGYNINKVEMWIVQPGARLGVPARLAWVIALQPIRSQSLPYNDEQFVTIDAYTGEILMNDAWA